VVHKPRFTFLPFVAFVFFEFLLHVRSLIFFALKMRNKSKSTPTLLCFLSFCLLPLRASPNLSDGIQKSQISNTQGMILPKRFKRGHANAQHAQVLFNVGVECIAAVSCSDLSLSGTLSCVAETYASIYTFAKSPNGLLSCQRVLL